MIYSKNLIYKKNAFTLLEVIFVIVVMAFIVGVAIPKFFESYQGASKVKIRTNIASIRAGIQKYKNDKLLKSDMASFPEVLDDIDTDTASTEVFSNVASDLGIRATTTEDYKTGEWIKLSESKYLIVITEDKAVEFIYDKETGKFDCLHEEQDYCEDITR